MFGWLSSHWKAVASVAVAAVVFTAVTVATGGLGAPVAAALLAGGFASGVAGYATSELLDGRTPTVKGALVQGTVAAGLTVATFGVGRVLAPVVAPIVESVLPEAVASAVPAVVGRTVTNSAVGATFGTGIQVAENAATNRPLLENTQDAAILGAMSGALVEPTVRAVSAVAPGPRVVAPPPIDPVTQTTMTRYGMTPDTILYRVTEPKWVQDGQISGNPKSMAIVADPYNMIDHPWAAGNPGLELPKIPRQVNASSLGPSLNVALKDPGVYGDPGMVKIGIRLGDVLAAGGKIYPDTGAMAQGLKPLIVTFDGSVPVSSVEPLATATASGTTTSDTTAQPLPAAPSKTKGITAALGQD